ncbi:HAD hydrolase-like protein [uncultured Croceitalea sp.]|uniref:HAD family hydrolase n=1 Tax=uncultured Croceitalea sp. TaxID=1798908 RepID=UPI00330645AC
MLIENVFFDFDGVLAESVSAKTEAFKEMYLPYGEDIALQVVNYHIENGGISRYEKFRHWEKTFFNKELDEGEVKIMAQRFSDLVLQKVIDAKPVKDSLWFLQKYYDKLRFWVITGTPTNEIITIVEKRKLDIYFQGLHGSPESKKYWTEFLIDKFKLRRETTLFLGDATTDIEAARFSKLLFALRDNEENKSLFEDYQGFRFTNFKELEQLLINNKLL